MLCFPFTADGIFAGSGVKIIRNGQGNGIDQFCVGRNICFVFARCNIHRRGLDGNGGGGYGRSDCIFNGDGYRVQ